MGDSDFDDDLDEALTQQVIEEFGDDEKGGKSSPNLAPKSAEVLEDTSELNELQVENKRLKDEICFLRSKMQNDQHVQNSFKANMESNFDSTSRKYQKDIEKLNFELEFKDHELSRIQASKNGGSPKNATLMDRNRSLGDTASRKRTSNVLEDRSRDEAVLYDKSDYRFYENKAPLLSSNGEPVFLTDEEKQIRMNFFKTTFKTYSDPFSDLSLVDWH